MSAERAVPQNPFVNSVPGDVVIVSDLMYVVGKGRRLIRLPTGSHLHPGRGYHHTDTGGLLGILENNLFWASSPMALNDLREVYHGQEVVLRVWDEVKIEDGLDSRHTAIVQELLCGMLEKVLSSTFVLSVAGERDSLNQWQGYSSGQGYAVGVNLTSHLNPQPRSTSGQPSYVDSTALPGWYKVVYEVNEQIALCREVLHFLAGDDLSDEGIHENSFISHATSLLATLILRLKDPAFRYEREYRYMTSHSSADADEHIVWWRTGVRGPVPYVRLVDRDAANHAGPLRGTLPLSEVLCGPGADAGTVALVRRLVASTGYQRVAVKESRVPYRPTR